MKCTEMAAIAIKQSPFSGLCDSQTNQQTPSITPPYTEYAFYWYLTEWVNSIQADS